MTSRSTGATPSAASLRRTDSLQRRKEFLLSGEQKLFASYTRVSNLAYHTPNVSERYAIYSVGLGRGWSDYDEVRAGVDIALVPRTPLRLYAAYRRQGEGDYRLPYPDESEYATTPAIFSGVVWKTTRVAIERSDTDRPRLRFHLRCGGQ